MPSVFRTGEAARALGVTPYWVRRACAGGLLQAQNTESGQLRIPSAEIERLQKQKQNGGLPALPLPADVDPGPEISNNPRRRSPLLGPPSAELVNDAESVVGAANRVKRWQLRKQEEELKDFFRERDAQAQDAELERERIHASAALDRDERAAARRAEEQRREAAEQVQTERRLLFSTWYARGVGLIPWGVPAPTRAACLRAIDETLRNADLEFGSSLELELEAAIEIALADWRCEQATEAAIDKGVLCLPAAARGWGAADYQDRARLAAADAIEELRDGASPAEKEVAARRAVAPIAQDFAAEQKLISEQRVRDELVIVQWWDLGLTGVTESDYETARREIRGALEELPVGTSHDQLRKARADVLERIKSRAKAQTTRAEQRAELGRTVSQRLQAWLPHADRYIDAEYEFANSIELRSAQQNLRGLISKELGAELRMRGGGRDMSDHAIQEFIESLIDEELDR